MKALSIRQPWASLIVHGFKDIENRTWNTKFRGRFLVHAGLMRDHHAQQPLWRKPIDYPMGALIGSVELVDVLADSDSTWFTGPVGFKLANPIVFPKPIEWPGQLNFFNVKTLDGVCPICKGFEIKEVFGLAICTCPLMGDFVR